MVQHKIKHKKKRETDIHKKDRERKHRIITQYRYTL